MVLNKIIKELQLQVHTVGGNLEVNVTGVYISDLLSDVIANAKPDDLWLTLQVHPNIVAVYGFNIVGLRVCFFVNRI